MRGSERAPDDVSDADLVLAARSGSRAAEESLFRRHVQRAHRLAVRILANNADAQDVTHDAFIIAFQRLDTLREPAAFRGWLRTLVSHSARRVLRRRSLLRRLGLAGEREPELDGLLSHDASPESQLELRQLFDVMSQWPVEERLAFSLHDLEGLTLEEVAEATGVSPATAKRRVRRARERLERLPGRARLARSTGDA